MIKNIFNQNERYLRRIKPLVVQTNSLEKEVSSWSDAKFPEETARLKERIAKSSNPEEELRKILPAAFAMVREASNRTIGMRHFDVQLMAGIVGFEGNIFEQKTGEGKTLAATLPLYLRALKGGGVHLVTVNDYLSKRDMGWMAPVYHFLGLTSAALVHDNQYIYDPEFHDDSATDARLRHMRNIERREAYAADIVYGTNAQFGFDYLRDNMVQSLSQMVQRVNNGHYFALIDEVDSILIDEARTPLIISAPAEEAVERYYTFAKMADGLVRDTDYDMDEKFKHVTLTDIGIRKIERIIGVDNLFEKDFETLHHVENALRAKALYTKDRDYVVREGELIIVDEFTGRLMFGRRFSEGMHQALEAKEGLQIQRESRTLATVTIQNYFRMYEILAGMTGTAKTEEEEFYKIYKLEVVSIPSNKPVVRNDKPDMVYRTPSAKYRAIINEIEDCNRRGQPVLIGTTSIEKNEMLHGLLARRNIPHQVLNAKNHEQEAEIIADAGKFGSVTLATNIAGRGVDIELGGAGPKKYEGEKWDESLIKAWQEQHNKVVNAGGLHVLGTERHESRRIDNQLRGRSGRQGDPGSSRFYVSLEDDLMRIFGGEKIAGMLNRFKVDEDTPIESSIITKTIENSQKKVEGFHFDTRRHVLDYDDVNNLQRNIIYKMRLKILRALSTEGVTKEDINLRDWLLEKLAPYESQIADTWDKKEKELGKDTFEKIVQLIALDTIDVLWMDVIDILQHIRQDVSLRGYGQKDPVMEYKREGRALFERLIDDIYGTIAKRIEQIQPGTHNIQVTEAPANMELQHDESAAVLPAGNGNISALGVSVPKEAQQPVRNPDKVGRNDPCPCGAVDPKTGFVYKYKKCGLINASYHKG